MTRPVRRLIPCPPLAALLPLAAVLPLALAGPAAAHPHLFVDTGVEAIFDGDGRLAAVRLTWIYDEFTTMSAIADGGYDRDGDGALSQAEMQPLQGFDMEWGADFLGDFEVERAGETIPLVPGPQDWTSAWKDGHLMSTHVRRLVEPLDPATGPILLKPYDPGYYTDYSIVAQSVSGRADCSATLVEPDEDAGLRALAAELDKFDATKSLDEMGYMMIGESFSGAVQVTCP
ncbi:DUF1007 family protein [Frigidibacter oleivorans]|uniref:DUF1007 family protein n=1 Tax=Frigidibacter oleivorans TaxID=2487129 RepID=UPI0013DFFD5E|nr:DUF1007 family protein [Frigidibacter oleivorans]